MKLNLGHIDHTHTHTHTYERRIYDAHQISNRRASKASGTVMEESTDARTPTLTPLTHLRKIWTLLNDCIRRAQRKLVRFPHLR